jgi:radical SAM protein with 4Fe4S-binding SPASM domain
LGGYFSLSNDTILVKGAKHSVLLDLKNKKIFRVNSSARSILELAGQGLTLEEVVKRVKRRVNASDTRSFIEDLSNQGLVMISETMPQSVPEKIPHPKLSMLWIEVTSRCNLRCVHCYATAENEDERMKELSTNEIMTIIDEAATLGCQEIQFTGGEATLRLDLKELIEHAGGKSVEIEVFTNGTQLNESIVKFFKEKNVNVAMSIYSYNAETHDSITQVRGSHERTLKSLKLLQAHGVPVRCGVVAMKQNESELEETCHFLSRLGVLERPPDPIRPTGRAKGLEYWPTEYGKKHMQTKPAFMISREDYERNRWWNSCWVGKAAVTAQGDVLPCVFARSQVVGNVRNQTLTEIVKSKAMVNLWSLTNDQIEVCKDCEYRYVCEDCRPWASEFTGNLHAKSPKCKYNPYSGEWGSASNSLC